MKPDIVQGIIDQHSKDGNGLISILENIQARFSYLPEEALRMVSEAKNIPLTEIYGVATFYRAFSLKPRGRHLVTACLGTACHVRGGQTIVKELEKQLGIYSGNTTSDKEFTLETAACLGACALGPVVVVDGRYFPKVGKSKVRQIIQQAKEGFEEGIAQDYHIFPVEVSCPRCNHNLMDPDHFIDDYPAIRLTMSFGREHGWIELSSMYGSHKVFSEHEIPMDTVVHFFCPHCHVSLNGTSPCTSCGAPMVPMMVRGGGTVQICSRRGCNAHMLDLG